jgi:hypothetical protein
MINYHFLIYNVSNRAATEQQSSNRATEQQSNRATKIITRKINNEDLLSIKWQHL